MTLQELQTALRTRPFKPFRLYVSGGETFDVRHSELCMPGLTSVMTTDTTFGESEGILAARYGGTEPAVHRRFMCLMLGSTSGFTIFYYEAVGLTQSETDARSKTIMNSVVVPK